LVSYANDDNEKNYLILIAPPRQKTRVSQYRFSMKRLEAAMWDDMEISRL
jgi:hypothetical protein